MRDWQEALSPPRALGVAALSSIRGPDHASPCASASGSTLPGPRRKSRLPAFPSCCSAGPASGGGASWARPLCARSLLRPRGCAVHSRRCREAREEAPLPGEGRRPEASPGGSSGPSGAGAPQQGGGSSQGGGDQRSREPGTIEPGLSLWAEPPGLPFQRGKLRPRGQDPSWAPAPCCPSGRQPPAQVPSGLLLGRRAVAGGPQPGLARSPLECGLGGPHGPTEPESAFGPPLQDRHRRTQATPSAGRPGPPWQRAPEPGPRVRVGRSV